MEAKQEISRLEQQIEANKENEESLQESREENKEDTTRLWKVGESCSMTLHATIVKKDHVSAEIAFNHWPGTKETIPLAMLKAPTWKPGSYVWVPHNKQLREAKIVKLSPGYVTVKFDQTLENDPAEISLAELRP